MMQWLTGWVNVWRNMDKSSRLKQIFLLTYAQSQASTKEYAFSLVRQQDLDKLMASTHLSVFFFLSFPFCVFLFCACIWICGEMMMYLMKDFLDPLHQSRYWVIYFLSLSTLPAKQDSRSIYVTEK